MRPASTGDRVRIRSLPERVAEKIAMNAARSPSGETAIPPVAYSVLFLAPRSCRTGAASDRSRLTFDQRTLPSAAYGSQSISGE
jgi:hypothetical protein